MFNLFMLSSQIAGDRLAPFEEFSEHYHTNNMKGMYKKAVISALKVCLIPVTVMSHSKAPWSHSCNFPVPFQGPLVSFW